MELVLKTFETRKRIDAGISVEWEVTREDLGEVLRAFLWKASYRPGLWVYMTTDNPVLAAETPKWVKDGEEKKPMLMPTGRQLVSIDRNGYVYLMNVIDGKMLRTESVAILEMCEYFGVDPGVTFGDSASKMPMSRFIPLATDSKERRVSRGRSS
jgi:hypothetical protein